MCRKAASSAIRRPLATPFARALFARAMFMLVMFLAAASGRPALAQAAAPEWRHIGNGAVDEALASVSTGPVERVWYSPDGGQLFIRTASGRVYMTADFEQWQRVLEAADIPPGDNAVIASPPGAAWTRAVRGASAGRLYGIGQNAYRSDDGGETWVNLTAYQGASLLGGAFSDLAASPRNADELVVANGSGVWRSVDGGLSWTGLNQFLPNLPGAKLLAPPAGARGVRLALRANPPREVEWQPGEKSAWHIVEDADLKREQAVKAGLSEALKRTITAAAAAGNFVYAGDSEGRLFATSDQGGTWARFALADLGPVEAIWVDAKDPRIAIAALGARANAPPGSKPAFVFRTMNGGIFWDDITSNLPDGAAAHGIVADRSSGAIYAATGAGVFFTVTDLAAAGRSTPWVPIGESLPAAPALDVRLDGGGNQLYALIDGYGVYAAMAPHRLREARVVSAADFSLRAAAPGSLLSVLGARVQSARTSTAAIVPVLAASDTASQIQLPFEVKGSTVSMVLDGAGGPINVGLPLQNTAPAIFIDPDGAPMILDGDSGVMLDATRPAHSNARIQVLAAGLGRVKPDWPAGVAAPLNAPPKVLAPVRAWLDRSPVDVTEAVLAPGYIGFYLVEIQLPRIVNRGPAELYIEAEGQPSNRVRLYLEP